MTISGLIIESPSAAAGCRKVLKTGEAGFLQERQAAANALVSDGAASLTKTITSAEDLAALFPENDPKWGEIAFNEEKKRKAKIMSYLLGVLHPDLVTPQLVADAEAHIVNANKLQRERANKQALIRKKVTQKEAGRGHLVFF